MPSLAILGFGNMGKALYHRWVEVLGSEYSFSIIDPHLDKEACQKLEHHGHRIVSENEDLNEVDTVIVAVKPQIVDGALSALHQRLTGDELIISIVAGKSKASLLKSLGRPHRLIRTMPNTPAMVGEAATVMVEDRCLTQEDRKLTETLFNAVGLTTWVDDERLMDAVTAISGSGPAYIFYLCECLTEAAINLGLSEDVAKKLARQTVVGGGALLANSDLSAVQLRKNVTSPGGTTESALKILMGSDGLETLIKTATLNAQKRSLELNS